MSSAGDNIRDILNYYSQNQESQRHQTQQLEFALMTRVLKAHLTQKSLRILELGAGAGFYTRLLVEMGHQIVAVEPVDELIQANQAHCSGFAKANQVEWIQKDARELQGCLQRDFDVILNMGPFYHLVDSQERSKLMENCRTWLRPQGLLISIFLSRVGYLSYLLAKQPHSIVQDPEGFRDILTQGQDPQHPRNGTFRGYFTELNEMASLHQLHEMEIQKLYVLDPCIGGEDLIFNRLSDELKSYWAEILFAFSADPTYWNTGRTWAALSTRKV